MTLLVRKATGQLEPFNRSKLVESLVRAGLSDADADTVLDRVEGQLEDGMTTRELRRIVRRALRQFRRGTYYRYDLKRAIERLGPAGYPFEDFMARVFAALGYECAVRQVVDGRCASHEVDIVIRRGPARGVSTVGFVECKFHVGQRRLVTVKDALYIFARFVDLREGPLGAAEGWLATNTRFTSEAIRYAECAGLRLISWAYPRGTGLERVVEAHQLYPVTILGALNRSVWEELYRHDILLVRELVEREASLRRSRFLPKPLLERLVHEAWHVLEGNGADAR